jgi:hypothetical protein
LAIEEGGMAAWAQAAEPLGPAETERRARIREHPLAGGRAIIAALALAKFVLHMATAGRYGFFIDELYFLACGEHLAWGYVDFPPLTAFQAWLTRALFGDSPYSIRLFPALAGAGLVVLAAAVARRLGGGRLAQALTALAVLAAPIFMVFGTYLSMNAIEPLVWTGCALVLIRMIQTRDARLWLLFGLVAGIGLLNKHTVFAFGFALVVGLLLTPPRALMANRWFLLGGLVAFLVFLPNLVWEIGHGFPHRELLANIRRNGRDVDVGFFHFWGLELYILNPLAAPVWILGLVGLFRSRELRPFRALGWAFVLTIGLFLLTPGSHKIYYVASAYPMALAAGAVVLERWAASPLRRRMVLAYAGVVALSAVLIAPGAVPLLEPTAYFRYTAALGLTQPRFENRAASSMPQLFADRFGWPEMVETVAAAYHALPAAEREKTAIFANDYGQGGAIDFYGPRHGLPKAIGGHLSYWYWGPRGYTGQSVIVLGDRREVLEGYFEDVTAVATVGHPYAMRQEHFTVFLCRRPRGWTLAAAWPQLKKWE